MGFPPLPLRVADLEETGFRLRAEAETHGKPYFSTLRWLLPLPFRRGEGPLLARARAQVLKKPQNPILLSSVSSAIWNS